MMNDFQLSPHFNLREFQNTLGQVMVDPELVKGLEELRDALGSPSIIITSGYRSEADNEALAGRVGWIEDGGLVSKDSQHVRGKAADIVVYDYNLHKYLSPAVVAMNAEPIFSYVKAYEAHVHVDVR